MSRMTDTRAALAAFSALSQETRLEAFRLLVKAEPEGLPAGEIARGHGFGVNRGGVSRVDDAEAYR